VTPSIRGRVWKFGDNISTDLMLPGRITYPVMAGQVSPEEAATHCMLANRPGWYKLVESGDIIVGGANFGAGSGRPAHLPLQALGIRVVLAESVARLFYRNCINGGFLVIACPGIGALVEEGDTVDVRLRDGVVSHPGSGRTLTFPALPPDSPPMEILRAGGLVPYMKARLGLNTDSG
jgi:3-isopropylmalate/(R)-2-methylmalate dehydratase small subunit